jgi:hypothetical protein
MGSRGTKSGRSRRSGRGQCGDSESEFAHSVHSVDWSTASTACARDYLYAGTLLNSCSSRSYSQFAITTSVGVVART